MNDVTCNIMDMNIRNIDANLLHALKEKASNEGKTLRQLCIDVLSEAMDVTSHVTSCPDGYEDVTWDCPVDLLAKIDAQGDREKTIIAILEAHYASPFVKPAKVATVRAQTDKPVTQPETSASTGTGQIPPLSPPILAVMEAQRATFYPSITAEQLGWSHDPKTCKIYRCGRCAIAKEKP